MFLGSKYGLAIATLSAGLAQGRYADDAVIIEVDGDAPKQRCERDPEPNKPAISIPRRLEPHEFSTADVERMARADARRAAKVARQARGFVTPNPSDHQHPVGGEEHGR
jgi:hypothetical protein